MGSLKNIELTKLKGGKVGKNVRIRAAQFHAVGTFSIGDDVSIEAERVDLGDGASVEKGTVVRGLRGPMERFRLGDESSLSFGIQVLVPRFEMGDYSQLHNSSLASGYYPIRIGHNCWIGQQTVLNSTQRLTLGNNVRIGTQSQLWTHVASGELLEGCTLFGEEPLVLEDNVWVVGGAVISPGLIVRRNSIIMVGSVLTKSTEPFHVYGGIPAVDLTAKIPAWKPVTIQDKLVMVRGYVGEFLKEFPRFEDQIEVLDLSKSGDHQRFKSLVKRPDFLLIASVVGKEIAVPARGASVFDLSSKTYWKRRTEIEKRWLWFNVGYRARFIPQDNRSGFESGE